MGSPTQTRPSQPTQSQTLNTTTSALLRITAAILFILLFTTTATTNTAIADGKFFAVISPDQTDPTIPHQRAIIGWNPPTQTLAIDTAFVGEGEDFAWLVPLPSRPDISPLTPGVFEAASAITAPRVNTDRYANIFLSLAMFLTIAFGFLLFVHFKYQGANKSAANRISVISMILIFLFIYLPFEFFPNTATPRGLGTSEDASAVDPSVTVHSRSHAGVYDTAVLETHTATELLDWLNREGFHAPQDIEPVVQNYIDQGWVFAAARVSTINNTQQQNNNLSTTQADPWHSRHRPHPLLFTFETDRPVYPMALTAVGNTAIQLDLYILADGSPRTPNLTSKRSMTTARADPNEPSIWVNKKYNTRDLNNNPRLVHEELDDISLGRANITHLSGTLSPAQQTKDIYLNIGQFSKHDPLLIRREMADDAFLDVLFWPSAVTLSAIYFLVVYRRITDSAAIRALKLAAIFIPVISISSGLAARSNLYDGEITWQRGPKWSFESTLNAYVSSVMFLEIDVATQDAISITEQITEHMQVRYPWLTGTRPIQREQDHNRGAPSTFRVGTDPITGAMSIYVRCPAGQLIVIDATTAESRTLQYLRNNQAAAQ